MPQTRVIALLLGALLGLSGGPSHDVAPVTGPLTRHLGDPAASPPAATPPRAALHLASDSDLNDRGWRPLPAAAAAPARPLDAALLDAYLRAATVAPPGCHLTVSLLAAIGQVESGNLAGRALDADNRAVPAVLGPVLDGRRYSAVRDTDAGHWDGDPRWDRALGPLQLLPATWRVVGVDLDLDGVRDPQDVYDAAGAAMVYLCSGARDLATPAGLRDAVLAYNHSRGYLRAVLAAKRAFDRVDLAGAGVLALVMWLPPRAPQRVISPVVRRAQARWPAHHATVATRTAMSPTVTTSPAPTPADPTPTAPAVAATPSPVESAVTSAVAPPVEPPGEPPPESPVASPAPSAAPDAASPDGEPAPDCPGSSPAADLAPPAAPTPTPTMEQADPATAPECVTASPEPTAGGPMP